MQQKYVVAGWATEFLSILSDLISLKNYLASHGLATKILVKSAVVPKKFSLDI